MENREKTQQILNQLTIAVKGSDKELYDEKELIAFANSFQDVWSEDMDDDFLVNCFLDYWWDSDKPCRQCSVCGRLMREGYCLDMGKEYFCSDECLHTSFPNDNDWREECECNPQSYYTTWY